jgi:CheY-like chemotaxis protein
MREYLRKLLSPRFNVVTTVDGSEALAAIDARLPDLVLTDVMMPKLDGFALLKALRGNDRTRDIPVVLLSARAGEESRIEGIDAGADDYVVKPFSARELHARVSSNLAMARARRNFSRAARENEARRSFLLTLSDALRAMSSTAAVSQCAVDHIGRQLGATAAGYGEIDADAATLHVMSQWHADGSTTRACCTDRPRPLRAGRRNTRRRAHRHRRHAPARPCKGMDRRGCGRDHRRFASDRWPHGSDAVGQCSGIARVERRGSRAAG